VDSYGAAETNKSFENRLSLAADGKVQRRGARLDSEVEIISPEGKPVAPGEMGQVRVRNPYMIKGYLNAPEATARVFRDGWFHPGDIATWGEADELVIIGRDDDVINLGGYKLNAGFLDMFFSRIKGIREAIVFQNPKSNAVSKVLILAIFEPDAVQHDVREQACQLARSQLGVLLSPEAFRAVTAIPKTKDGDPDRKACRAMVLQYSKAQGDDAGEA
jgi:acyl-CoA synthetase (AMP-forming)/AMP-acid ligase II